MGMFDDLIPQNKSVASSNPSTKPYRTDPPPAPISIGSETSVQSAGMFDDLIPSETSQTVAEQPIPAVGKKQSTNPFIDSFVRTLTQANPNALASTLDAAAANEPSPLFPKMRYIGDPNTPQELRKQSDYVATDKSINPEWTPEKGLLRKSLDSGLLKASSGLRNLAANEENLPQLKNYGIQDIIQGDGVIPALNRTNTFVREGIGSAFGSMVPTVAGGIAGFAIPTVIGQPQLAPVGAVAGAFAPSYALNAGGVWDALKEENAKAAKEGRETLTPAEMSDLALGSAIPISALDVAGLESIASGLAGSAKKEIFRAAARKVLESSSRAEGLKEGAKLIGKETAKEAGKGFVGEGATEGGQQAIQDLTTTKPYGKDYLTKETALDVANNAIIGGLAGAGRGVGPVSLAPSINAASKRIGKDRAQAEPEIVESTDSETQIETPAEPVTTSAKGNMFEDLIPKTEGPKTESVTSSQTATTLETDNTDNTNNTDNVVKFPEKKSEPQVQKLVTPRGDQEIEAMFDVVDAKNLITSDHPEFPQVLQPRDRSRKTSDLQIQDISNKLDPERLSESRTTDTGAPIVSMDNIVESGNGRVMGIRKAYEQGNDAAKNYRKFLEDRGYDVSGMEQPILVRKRKTELSPEDRVRFTIASNERTGASLSSTERAMADAKTISDDMAGKYVGGDVTSPENRGFINSFISQVAPADRGSMISADGELSQDGVRRIRGALLAKAYDDSDVVQSTLENNDTEIKSIGNALTSVAGQVAAFKAGVQRGETPKSLDITSNIIEAAKIIRDAKAKNKPVADALTQGAMFDEQKISPLTESIIRAWYNPAMKRQMSQQKIEAFLRKYYEEAAKANEGGNMFGLPDITPQDIIDIARPTEIDGSEKGDTLPLETTPNISEKANKTATDKKGVTLPSGTLEPRHPLPVNNKNISIDKVITEEKSPLSATKAKVLAEKAPHVLDIDGKQTGWKKLVGDNKVTLVNPKTGETKLFVNKDQKSGTEWKRTQAKAQEYAIDNPIVSQQSEPAEMVVKKIGKKDKEPSQIKQGKIGMMLSAGEKVLTTTGRETTPFPKFQTTTGKTTQKHLNDTDKWLMQNALDEALSRGDDFNATSFRANLNKPSQADKDSAEHYLFGAKSEQPKVIKSILKDMGTKAVSKNVEATAKPFHNHEGELKGYLALWNGEHVARAKIFKTEDEAIQAAIEAGMSEKLKPKKRRSGARGGDASILPEDMNAPELKDALEERLADEVIATGKAGRKTGREFAKLVVKSYENWLGRVGDSPVLRQLVENHLGSGLSIQGENVRAINGTEYNQQGDIKTETPAFKKWFGDSKVVDADGKPLVVYHGTGSDIEKFEKKNTGAGSRESPLGYWFTDNPDAASDFAGFAARGTGANVVPVYISMQNPLYVKDYSEIKDIVDDVTKFDRPNYTVAGRNIRMQNDKINYDLAVKKLKKKGYDGIILENTLVDSPDKKTRITQYLVFDKPQAKSIHNKGTWNKKDDRILYQKDDATTPISYEKTELGWQAVLPGAEKVSQTELDKKKLIEKMQEERLRAKSPQQQLDFGLFDQQKTLFQRVGSTKNQNINTPAFKKWFGDSKVVDADGKPLVVYHGTNQNIDEFKKEKLGKNTNAFSATAFYFTDNPDEAAEYADMSARKQVSNADEMEAKTERLLKEISKAERKGDFDTAERLYLELEENEQEAMSGEDRGANILPVYLSIKNPMIYDMQGSSDLVALSEVIKEAREKGHDGLRLDNVFDPVAARPDKFDTVQWVAFEPQQIKSVNNRGTFDANDPRILYQYVNQSAEGLRSALVSAATNLKQAKGTGEQMLGILRNTAGVKEEEISWTGLDDFLADKPTVSKQEIVDYLDQNQVKIDEVTLDDNRAEKYAIVDGDDIIEDGFSNRDDAENRRDELEIELDTTLYVEATEGTDSLTGETASGNTKFSQYTLPGGENYREVLLTLPQKEVFGKPYHVVRDELLNPALIKVMGDTKAENALRRSVLMKDNPNWKNDSDYEASEEAKKLLIDGGYADVLDQYISSFDTNDQIDENRKNQFKSSHFDQPNILAHVRLNDRIDANGKRVLFVEEIQSDMHQQGRKKGYKGELPNGWTVEPNTDGMAKFKVRDENGVMTGYGDTESEAIAMTFADKTAVPNAPFKKSWHEMAFRRVVQMAAQEGYDSVAWTTGEQQNDRYDLSKTLEWASYNKKDEQLMYRVKNGGTELKNVAPNQLEDFVGKDLAAKLLDDNAEKTPAGTIRVEGDSLKIGGSGMKGFYDNILVKYANKFGKKFGAKVGEASFDGDKRTENLQYEGKIPTFDQVSEVYNLAKGKGNTKISPITGRPLANGFVLERVAIENPMQNILDGMKEGKTFEDAFSQYGTHEVADVFGGKASWGKIKESYKVHSMDITLSMRESADKGFDLFQRQDGEARGSITFMPDGKTLINMFDKANASTPFHELGHDFLELLKNVASNEEAPANVAKDWKTTQNWLGLSDGQPISTEQHEQFARGFEAYLREGKAPTSELKSLFDTFKQWLTDIYRSITKLDVELTDEMRGVFDRMIAGDKIEDISGGAGEMSVLADRSSKIPTADINHLTKTERASLSKLIWEENGYDPDKVQRYSLDRQFEIAEKALSNKFGLSVQMGKDGNKRHAVDNMADLYVGLKTMAALNGLPEKLMGLQKVKMTPDGKESGIALRFVFKKDKRNGILGAYLNKTHQIHIPGRSNSVAHEWGHALDYSVLEAMGDKEDAVGRAFRGYSGKIRRVGEQNFKADSVAEAWVDLMNTIFFDDALSATTIMQLQKKIETTKSDKVKADAQEQIDRIKAGNWQGKSYRSQYFRNAKSIPTGSDKGYWTRPTEMVARAIESFMSDKFKNANLPTDIMTFGNEMYQQGSAFEKLYPQGPDRERIFAKIAAVISAIQESDILDTGNLTPAELPKDIRVDPLAMVKAQNMKKYPSGVIGQIRKELGQIKSMLNDIRNPDAKKLASEELKKGKVNINKAVDGWVRRFQASAQERKVLQGLTRMPETYKKPPKMADTRFAELKDAAIEIRKTYDRPLADRALSNLKTMVMAINSSEKAMMHAIEARNPKSKALSEIISHIAASPGKKRDSANTYTSHKRQFVNKYGNRLAAIVDNFGLEKGLMSWKKNKLETQLLRDLYFNPDSASIPSGVTKERAAELATAAAELNRLIKDVSYEFDRAGIDVGETHDVPYLRRIYDKAKIWADKKGFLEQARKTYLVKYEKEIGEAENLDLERFIDLAVEAGFKDDADIKELKQFLAEEKKNQIVPAPIMTEINPDLYDAVVDSASRKDAQDWLNNMYLSPEYSMGGSPSGFMKARALPAEADQLLQDYMVSDPIESTLSLIEGAADKVSWRKYVEPEDGYLLNAERQAISDGWHFEDTQLIVDMIRAEGSRANNSVGPIRKAYQATVGLLHTAATVALMGRSVFASLAEPITYLHRTGHWNGSVMIWKNLVKDIMGKADAREKRRIIQAWGLIENRLTAVTHAERAGGLFEDSPRTQRFMNRFFESNLLAPLTRAQRSAAMQTLPVWFNVLSHDILDADSKPHRKRAAIREFVEAGVPENKVEEFSHYVQSLNMGFPSIDESYLPKTMPQMYMNAIGYVTDHIIQNPSRMDRPLMANSPTGRFVYGLMSFQFAYYDNVIKRKLSNLKEDFKQDGFAVGAAHTAEFAAALALQISLAATVFLLRSALFNPDLLDKKMEDDELFDYVAAGGFSYASPLSPLASMGYNIWSSAKYQKDLSNYFVGAQMSYYLQPAEAWKNYFMNNSENTDTQDRHAMEASYRMFVGLPSAILSGMIPGGGVLGTTYGVANMFISSRGAETAVSNAVYGPKEKKGKKKSEKRYLGKNIGRSD